MGRIGKSNGDVVGIAPGFFQTLMLAPIFAIPPGMQYCFFLFSWIKAALVTSMWLFLPYSSHMTGQGASVRILKISGVSIPIMHSTVEERTTLRFWDTLGSL